MDASSDNGTSVSGRSTTAAAGILRGMSNIFGLANPGSNAVAPTAAGLPKVGDFVKLHYSEPDMNPHAPVLQYTLPGIVKKIDPHNKAFDAIVLINDGRNEGFLTATYTLDQINDDPNDGDWAPLQLGPRELVSYIVNALNEHVKRISKNKQQPNLYLTSDLAATTPPDRRTATLDSVEKAVLQIFTVVFRQSYSDTVPVPVPVSI